MILTNFLGENCTVKDTDRTVDPTFSDCAYITIL